jgi:beta-galactosidase
LIGTFPGAGYYLHHSEGTKKLFGEFINWGGNTQIVVSSDPQIKARIHKGPEGTYLWVINPTRIARESLITLNGGLGTFSIAKDLWGEKPVMLNGNQIRLEVGERDAVVISLQ